MPNAKPEHVGSIDVDLALDAAKLGNGLYAELLKLLLETGRYEKGEKAFQLMAPVNLDDGESPVKVDVDFLAPTDVKLQKNHPKLMADFRVLQVPSCTAAFDHPENVKVEGEMISGAKNTVRLQVASLPDFIIMKAHAVGSRDKPKDVYDICYCLDDPEVMSSVAADWRSRHKDPLVIASIEILAEKFRAVDYFGPKQLAIFHNATDDEERAMHIRRAFELVQKLLALLRQ
jgi:hypothetical protein